MGTGCDVLYASAVRAEVDVVMPGVGVAVVIVSVVGVVVVEVELVVVLSASLYTIVHL